MTSLKLPTFGWAVRSTPHAIHRDEVSNACDRKRKFRSYDMGTGHTPGLMHDSSVPSLLSDEYAHAAFLC